nr:MAG TPA: hypothetical protein [Bacteriophage sp.]
MISNYLRRELGRILSTNSSLLFSFLFLFSFYYLLGGKLL